MRRLSVAFLLFLFCALGLSANERRQGYCQAQNTGARVLSCTVTVYLQGTLTLAPSVFSDNLGTPKSNPFTADANSGLWFFYAPNGRYDIQFSGGTPTISPAYTMPDVYFIDLSVITSLSASTITSLSTNPALTGFIEMAPGDCLSWRNNASSADKCLTENGSDQLSFSGVPLLLPNSNIPFTGINTISSLNKIIYCDGVTYLGTSALQNALAALPAGGGIVDCSNPLIGNQILSSDPVIPQNSTLYTGPYQIQLDPTVMFLTYPSHFHWTMHDTTVFNSNPTGGVPSTFPNVQASVAPFTMTRLIQTTGAITSGTKTVTVNSPTGISIGAMLAVVGANGGNSSQQSTISNSGVSITAGQTTVPLASASGWDGTHTNYFLIGSEMISCSSIVTNTLTGCTRGAFGTSTATHADTSAVQGVGALISPITNISGNVVTIADNATSTVSAAPTYSGVTDVTIDGNGTINGNQVVSSGTHTMGGVFALYSTAMSISPGIKIVNVDHAGVMCTASRYNNFNVGTMSGIGKPSSGLGSDLWAFEQCNDNSFSSASHQPGSSQGLPGGNYAFFADDRSTSFTINSGASTGNTAILGPIEGYRVGVSFEASSSFNTVIAPRIKTTVAGILIDTGQWTGSQPTPTQNVVYSGNIDGGAGAAVSNSGYSGTSGNVIVAPNIVAGTVSTLIGTDRYIGMQNVASTLYAGSFSRSAGNASFPDIYGDGTNALVLAGKIDGSGIIKVGATSSLQNSNGLLYTQTVGAGTTTTNGTAISNGVSQSQPAITVTGAAATDTATCSLNGAPPATWQTGIQLLLPVVTTNTVTVWLSNPTAAPITPAATVVRCTVTR